VTAARERLLIVPAWAWLAAIVAVSATIRAALSHEVVAPWIMVDELIYSELGKSVAAHGAFDVRGVPSHGYGFVYPLLIAPAFRIWSSAPTAYAAAKDIDSVVMSLAALPAYGIARRLLPTPHSLVVAALAVAVPSLLYTGELMTENPFYPLFLLVVLVLLATLERPTAFRQVALLVLCGVAYATRQQAIVLVPAALLAPLLLGWIERDLRARVRRFATLYAIVGAAVVLALLATAARGRSPLSLLGAYRAATGTGYSVSSVLHYLLWHAAELDLYVGVAPFAALLALWLRPRLASPAARAFVAATLPLTVLLVVEVAAFASTQSARIEERNMFYVAPFAFVALLGLAVEGVVPRGRALAAAAVAAGVLPVAIPFGRFVTTSAVSDTFALLPWWWLQDRGIHFGTIRWVALGVGLVVAAGALLPRRLVLAVPALVVVYFALTNAVVLDGRHGIRETSQGVLWAGIKKTPPDWIDALAGRHAQRVAVLWTPNPEPHPVFDTEFFNRSVGTIYALGADPWQGGLPETVVHVRSDGVVASGDTPLPPVAYALTQTDVEGQKIGADPQIGWSLYKVGGLLRVLTRIDGVDADHWGGRYVAWRRFDCDGGKLTVQLALDAQLFAADQTILAREDGTIVRTIHVPTTADPQHPVVVSIPLQPTGRTCRVTFTATTTRVPARIEGTADTRRLAAIYPTFVYTP
jgi:dolichyl-phosphate-mannose-protein mannosyltransferase